MRFAPALPASQSVVAVAGPAPRCKPRKIRIPIGFEGAAELIADLKQALA